MSWCNILFLILLHVQESLPHTRGHGQLPSQRYRSARSERAHGPGCILRSQKQGKVLQSEGLAHEYGDPGSRWAQNQIYLWCVCPAGPRPQPYHHLQRCGLGAPARGFQTYQEHKLSLNSFKNIQDPKKGLGGGRNFKKGKVSEIKYFYLKKAHMQNIYTHVYTYMYTYIFI